MFYAFIIYHNVFVCFVALRPKSTAMVIAGRSVHLTTLFGELTIMCLYICICICICIMFYRGLAIL